MGEVIEMARKSPSLKRKVGTREYRKICWVSTEGQTEKDYFSMDVFKNTPSGMRVRFPKDIHGSRRNPEAVMKRFQKAMRNHDFHKGDEAWLMVDVDDWPAKELGSLVEWMRSDSRYHLAISNPKFELFLLMHFEKGNGCTTSENVDKALYRHMPSYSKRLGTKQFSIGEIKTAIENAETKRACCKDEIPSPGMTDAHCLARRLLR